MFNKYVNKMSNLSEWYIHLLGSCHLLQVVGNHDFTLLFDWWSVSHRWMFALKLKNVGSSLLRYSLSLLFCSSGFHGEILIWGTSKWGRVRHLLRRRSCLVVLLINVSPFLEKSNSIDLLVIFLGYFFFQSKQTNYIHWLSNQLNHH